MTVWVFRDGELVEKHLAPRPPAGPYVSRIEPFQSPVTGREITSWRERDRDMRAVDAYDPRDVSTPYRRGRDVQEKEKQNGTGPYGPERG